MKKHLILLSIIVLTGELCQAQVDKNSELYRVVMQHDSLLFDVGFNTCDISWFEQLLSDDFEFVHDKDGISDKTSFLEGLKNGLCASPLSYQSRRALSPGSTEVYALYKNGIIYGAIQNGSHLFYETIDNGDEIYAGAARFSHLWLLESGSWRLSKSLSYDHQKYLAGASPVFDNDDDIAQWLDEQGIPAVGIGIITDGQLQQIRVFGQLREGVTAPYNTIFNVASLTKPVTAMVVLKLATAGLWDIDEPLYHYWTDPDIAADENLPLLTTRHVLSHQTGFANWRWTHEDERLRFEFAPGTGYQYSGEGFEYLRKALEKKFERSLQALAYEYVFQPLRMNDTRYFWDSGMDTSRVAVGYNNAGTPYKVYKNSAPNAADDLLTTIEDYGRFLVDIMYKGGFPDQLFSDMTMKHTEVRKDKFFGLGWLIYDLGDGRYALSHGGADEGCQTIAFIIPETGQGLLIFTSSDEGYKVYERLMEHYLGKYGKRIFDIETK